jgi:hypothetical protein
MELHDLQLAWRRLDAHLDASRALDLHALRDRQTRHARRGLRPLLWGQVVQMLFGVAMIALAASVWSQHRDSTAVLLSGVLVHAYGIAVTIAAGVVLGRLRAVDYAAPVVAIQRQLAEVRRRYVLSGMVAGLPWWVLWAPFMLVLAAGAGDVPGQLWLGSWLGWSGAGYAPNGGIPTWRAGPPRRPRRSSPATSPARVGPGRRRRPRRARA